MFIFLLYPLFLCALGRQSTCFICMRNKFFFQLQFYLFCPANSLYKLRVIQFDLFFTPKVASANFITQKKKRSIKPFLFPIFVIFCLKTGQILPPAALHFRLRLHGTGRYKSNILGQKFHAHSFGAATPLLYSSVRWPFPVHRQPKSSRRAFYS